MENQNNEANLSYEEKELNDFIVFQKKHCHKIGEEDSFSFYNRFSSTAIGVPAFFGIMFSFYIGQYNIIAALILIAFFAADIYVSFKDRKQLLRNVYIHYIAYKRVLDYINNVELEEYEEVLFKNIKYYDYIERKNYYNNIRKFYKEHYQFTWLYRNVTDEPYIDKKHTNLFESSMIDKGYCMCCGEYGAKKLSKIKEDFLLCDMCYSKEQE